MMNVTVFHSKMEITYVDHKMQWSQYRALGGAPQQIALTLESKPFMLIN